MSGDTTTEAEAPTPPPLSEFLINFPELDQAAGLELAALAADVRALDRKGSMALKLEVVTVGQKENRRVVVKVGSEVKGPRPDPDQQIFYTGDNGLSKDDPTQVRIDWTTGELITPNAPKDA